MLTNMYRLHILVDVCGFAWSAMEHGCMVYIEFAPRRQQYHVAPAMPALKYTTSVDIQKNAL